MKQEAKELSDRLIDVSLSNITNGYTDINKELSDLEQALDFPAESHAQIDIYDDLTEKQYIRALNRAYDELSCLLN